MQRFLFVSLLDKWVVFNNFGLPCWDIFSFKASSVAVLCKEGFHQNFISSVNDKFSVWYCITQFLLLELLYKHRYLFVCMFSVCSQFMFKIRWNSGPDVKKKKITRNSNQFSWISFKIHHKREQQKNDLNLTFLEICVVRAHIWKCADFLFFFWKYLKQKNWVLGAILGGK